MKPRKIFDEIYNERKRAWEDEVFTQRAAKCSHKLCLWYRDLYKEKCFMTDERIVQLYWDRDEAAVAETQSKYGRYLTKIAYNILTDMEDSLESVNDTYMYAWKSMPPHRPSVLSSFLAKITRRVAIDILRRKSRDKRIPSEYTFSLAELEECIPDSKRVEQKIEAEEMGKVISAYLKTLSPEARHLFIGRYFYLDSLKDVAKYCGMSESKAKSMLYRTRCGLKSYLEQEGYHI